MERSDLQKGENLRTVEEESVPSSDHLAAVEKREQSIRLQENNFQFQSLFKLSYG